MRLKFLRTIIFMINIRARIKADLPSLELEFYAYTLNIMINSELPSLSLVHLYAQ